MRHKALYLTLGLCVLLSVAAAALISAKTAAQSGCSPTACATCPSTAACADAQPAAGAKAPVIDAAKCNGCTRCVVVAPKTFGMTNDGTKAKVINPTGDKPEVIKSAADGCKRRAVTFR